MKALSVRQPYADMICNGEKWLEFRSRPTSHRGLLAIHASKSGDRYQVEVRGEMRDLPTGFVLCLVKIKDCRPMEDGDRDHPGAPSGDSGGWWVYEFEDWIEQVRPVAMAGRIGFFDVPDGAIEIVPEDAFWFDYI